MVMKSSLEKEIKSFNRTQKRLQKLLGPSAFSSKEYAQEKLRFLRQLRQQYHKGADGLVMALLRSEERGLEKLLYPNRIIRLLRRIARKITESPRPAESGAPAASKLEKIPFSQPLSSRERLEVEIYFQPSAHRAGKIQAYRARLLKAGRPEVSFTFKRGKALIAPRVLSNLLRGRPVQLEAKGPWFQLEIRQQQAQLRGFTPSFDLKKSLQALPLKENENPQLQKQLLEKLRRGERPWVHMGAERAYLEVDPQFKLLHLVPQQKASCLNPQTTVKPARKRSIRRSGPRLS